MEKMVQGDGIKSNDIDIVKNIPLDLKFDNYRGVYSNYGIQDINGP